jgi:hypothetical protein
MVMSTSLKLAEEYTLAMRYTHRLNLGESGRLDDCPLVWQNFIRSLHDDPHRGCHDDRGVPVYKVQNALSEFSAKWIESSTGDHVYFESADKLTWFILKWS